MALALLLVSSVIFLIFAYRLLRRPRFRLPPGPCPWPIVGNIFQLNPVMFRSFAEWSRLYGPIISVWVGSSLNIVVSDPELAKEVLKDNDQQLAFRNRNKALSILTSNGIDLTWADYGPHYVKVRKVCAIELFSPKSLEVFRPVREDEVSIMVESIFKDWVIADDKRKSSVLIRNYLQEVAFNYITRSVFGKRFRTAESEMDKHGAELKAIMADQAKAGASLLQIVEYIPGLRWMSRFQEVGFQKHLERLQVLFRAIIEDEQLSHKEYVGGARQELVAKLQSLQKANNLSEDTTIGLIWDMMTAGTDTSAIAVEWALTQLIRNPMVQKKAQEEFDHVIGSLRVMTESDLPNLPYLQAIAKEALRLHPTTPLMLPHKANANVKIGGYDVPQGTSVLVNVWAIARDPKVWKDPLEFRPERFLEEDVDIKGHDFRLLPFGSGRRVCPGAQLGLTLVSSMLGHLLHHFDWALPQGVKPEDIDMLEIPGVVAYMRTPLEAVPSPRLPSHLYKRESVI